MLNSKHVIIIVTLNLSWKMYPIFFSLPAGELCDEYSTFKLARPSVIHL